MTTSEELALGPVADAYRLAVRRETEARAELEEARQRLFRADEKVGRCTDERFQAHKALLAAVTDGLPQQPQSVLG